MAPPLPELIVNRTGSGTWEDGVCAAGRLIAFLGVLGVFLGHIIGSIIFLGS